MVFQSTVAFHRLSSYMVHPMKFLASVGVAQARPNDVHVIDFAFTTKIALYAQCLYLITVPHSQTWFEY